MATAEQSHSNHSEVATELKLQQLNDWLKEVRGNHGNQHNNMYPFANSELDIDVTVIDTTS